MSTELKPEFSDGRMNLPTAFHGFRYWIAPCWQDRLRSLPLTDALAWRNFVGSEWVSGSTVTNCYRVPIDDNTCVYFKRYVYACPQARYLLRPSKAVTEAKCYTAMAKAGLATLVPLAVGEQRRFGRLCAAYIVTQEVPETVSLQHFARLDWPQLEPGAKNAAYRSLADIVLANLKSLHASGFYHQDLKWRNILVRRHGEHWTCWWIDCPRGKYRRFARGRGELLDLSALARGGAVYLSKIQRLRFLLAYYNGDKDRARGMSRRVDAHLRRRPHRPERLRGG